jgi:4-hydroxythreonine-4-phosphate dehydrogenase
MNRKQIAVTIGDPAGIGPEIIAKTIMDTEFTEKYPFVVVAPPFIMDNAFQNILRQTPPKYDIIPIETHTFPVKYGKHCAKCGEIAMLSISHAVDIVKSGEFAALVTAPINKHSISLAGYDFAGHTEYLAHLTGAKDVSMMMASKRIKVILATTHIPLKDVSNAITHAKVLTAIVNAHKAGKLFGINKPRIAVCGLNPHAGDDGTLGHEEKTVINPAIQEAIANEINVIGLFAADAMYANVENFDISVAMYHDQGLIPVKMDGTDNVVNITLNLPIIRTSVGHGTAFDIAGKGIASPNSLKHAIINAHRIAEFVPEGCVNV